MTATSASTSNFQRQLAFTWLRQDLYDLLSDAERVKLLVDIGFQAGVANAAVAQGAPYFWATFCTKRRFGPSHIDRLPWRLHSTALGMIDAYLAQFVPSALAGGKAPDLNQCVICCDAEQSALLRPCNHMCACWTCSQRVAQCPVCRSLIKERLIVFKS